MAGSRYGSKLDTQLELQKEELTRMEGENYFYDVLEKKQKRLEEIENNWFLKLFRRGEIPELRRGIEQTEMVIKSKNLKKTAQTTVQNLRERIKELEGAKDDRMAVVQWKGFPERLNEEIQEKYLEKFRKLPEQIYEDVPSVNITMFGAVGVGKSSFLNTAVTALLNDPNRVSRKYVCGPMRTGHSKTKTFQLEEMRVEGTKVLPITFYDCPGINEGEDEIMNLDVLEAVINGHVKGESEFNLEEIKNKNGESYRKYPSLKNAMHCIVFVIKATTNMWDPEEDTLSKIKALQQRINKPRDVKQAAIVTYIDELGVPDLDMENVFRYKCVKSICKEVSEVLDIELSSVHPVANYQEEPEPCAEKSAMALMALWNIFQLGEQHIQQKHERRVDND